MSDESAVMSSSSGFMLNVDLNELNEPHKLAKWFKILGKYRKSYLNNIDNDDEDDYIIDDGDDGKNICESISKFMYETQICGKHIKYDFDENDFKQILNIIHNDKPYKYDHFRWIWDIIQYTQSINNSAAIKQQSKQPKLKWIPSSWNQFEIIEQDELDLMQKKTEKSPKSIIIDIDNMSPTKTVKSKSNTANTKNINNTKKPDDHTICIEEPSKSTATTKNNDIDKKMSKNKENIIKKSLDHSDDITDHYPNNEDEEKQNEDEIAKETQKLLVKKGANQSISRHRLDSASYGGLAEIDFAETKQTKTKGDYHRINQQSEANVNGGNTSNESLSVEKSISEEAPIRIQEREPPSSSGPCSWCMIL